MQGGFYEVSANSLEGGYSSYNDFLVCFWKTVLTTGKAGLASKNPNIEQQHSNEILKDALISIERLMPKAQLALLRIDEDQRSKLEDTGLAAEQWHLKMRSLDLHRRQLDGGSKTALKRVLRLADSILGSFQIALGSGGNVFEELRSLLDIVLVHADMDLLEL